MRIGVDARPLREKQTSGIPRYVRSLLAALAEIDKVNEYVLYAHKDFDFKLPPRFSKRSGALTRYGSVWMQAELPFWLTQDNIDVFWGTQHILPLRMSKKIKGILTMHDLVHYVFPETMKPLNLFINRLIIPPSVHRTDAIVAISHWTLSDVKKYLNPHPKVMKVAHLGVGKNFYPRDVSQSKSLLREKFQITKPFLLTVGTFEPRKNIAGIFKAYSLLADKIPHDLVVVGQKGWKNKQVLDEMLKSRISSRIHLLGYVEDELIPNLYSAADIFIFPSLYEGFGLPPLEAMACAVPVVSSNISSIPEVVDDAALLINPQNPLEISIGIKKILELPELRSQLIERGLRQAAQFTWDKAARAMVDVINELK